PCGAGKINDGCDPFTALQYKPMSNTCSVHVAPGNVARVVDALERRSGPWEIDGSKGELLRLAVGPENLLVGGAERERQNETQRHILLRGSHSPSICLLRVR